MDPSISMRNTSPLVWNCFSTILNESFVYEGVKSALDSCASRIANCCIWGRLRTEVNEGNGVTLDFGGNGGHPSVVQYLVSCCKDAKSHGILNLLINHHRLRPVHDFRGPGFQVLEDLFHPDPIASQFSILRSVTRSNSLVLFVTSTASRKRA